VSTVRIITADCATGDGSYLEVSTENQDSTAVLRFSVTDVEGRTASAYMSAEQLDEITPFIYREREAYELFDEAGCSHGLDGSDCVLDDGHRSVADVLEPVLAAGVRRHITAAGITWTANDDDTEGDEL
jgi:hypothetical protein